MQPPGTTFELATQVGERLRQTRRSLAVAESCTGGLLGAAITDVPGSSSYFLGGVISYADQVKVEQLGVPAATLQAHGAVSAETACAMATGVRSLLKADLGVSITGVAGPGAEGGKPVGLTYIAVATDVGVRAYHYQWAGDRWANRRDSVIAALTLLAGAADTMR
ncbi:MAG: CinA family protein [Candidatus Dormibacteraeota bacterium]|nr:CinA family protein [Candidatus Dormibacteraeota bacterium]